MKKGAGSENTRKREVPKGRESAAIPAVTSLPSLELESSESVESVSHSVVSTL